MPRPKYRPGSITRLVDNWRARRECSAAAPCRKLVTASGIGTLAQLAPAEARALLTSPTFPTPAIYRGGEPAWDHTAVVEFLAATGFRVGRLELDRAARERAHSALVRDNAKAAAARRQARTQ